MASPDSPYVTIIQSTPTVTDLIDTTVLVRGQCGGSARDDAKRLQRQPQLQQPRPGLRPAVQPAAVCFFLPAIRWRIVRRSPDACTGVILDLHSDSRYKKGSFLRVEMALCLFKEAARAMINAAKATHRWNGSRESRARRRAIAVDKSGGKAPREDQARPAACGTRIGFQPGTRSRADTCRQGSGAGAEVDKPGTSFPADAPIRLLGDDHALCEPRRAQACCRARALADRGRGPGVPGCRRLHGWIHGLPAAARRSAASPLSIPASGRST